MLTSFGKLLLDCPGTYLFVFDGDLACIQAYRNKEWCADGKAATVHGQLAKADEQEDDRFVALLNYARKGQVPCLQQVNFQIGGRNANYSAYCAPIDGTEQTMAMLRPSLEPCLLYSFVELTGGDQNSCIWRTDGATYATETEDGFQKESVAFFAPSGQAFRLNLFLPISERTRSQAALIRAKKRSAEKNQELNEFMYRLSHDIRGPLASIMSVLELLRTFPIDEASDMYLDMIDERAHQLDLYIHDTLSHSEHLRRDIELEPVDFQEAVNEALAKVKARYQNWTGGLTLQVQVDYAGEFVSDRFRIVEILRNLIANAFQFRRPYVASFVHVSLIEESDCLCVSVSDNGTGIADNVQPNIFKMFYRGTTQNHGPGLGLYIVRKAIVALEGEIDFESVAGAGTTFRIRLPKNRG